MATKTQTVDIHQLLELVSENAAKTINAKTPRRITEEDLKRLAVNLGLDESEYRNGKLHVRQGDVFLNFVHDGIDLVQSDREMRAANERIELRAVPRKQVKRKPGVKVDSLQLAEGNSKGSRHIASACTAFEPQTRDGVVGYRLEGETILISHPEHATFEVPGPIVVSHSRDLERENAQFTRARD